MHRRTLLQSNLKGLRLEIREKMAVRPLTYIVLKEAALQAEEIKKENIWLLFLL